MIVFECDNCGARKSNFHLNLMEAKESAYSALHRLFAYQSPERKDEFTTALANLHKISPYDANTIEELKARIVN